MLKKCVEELNMMMEYVRGLKFDETPKYDMLLKLVKAAGKRCGVKLDTNFDCIKPIHELKKEEDDFKDMEEDYLKKSLSKTDLNTKNSKYSFIINEVERKPREIQQ